MNTVDDEEEVSLETLLERLTEEMKEVNQQYARIRKRMRELFDEGV